MKGRVDAARHCAHHSRLILYARAVEGAGFLYAAISEKTGPHKAIGLLQKESGKTKSPDRNRFPDS